jgi:hypothetical protein
MLEVVSTQKGLRWVHLAVVGNVFVYDACDRWMARQFPGCPSERYADDAVIHLGWNLTVSTLALPLADELWRMLSTA